jgi:hypothetical protein
MDVSRVDHHIERFVLELLRTGSMLSGLLGNLVDALPVDAYPGEEPAAVVFEMLCGTIATALDSVDLCDVDRATELIDVGARELSNICSWHASCRVVWTVAMEAQVAAMAEASRWRPPGVRPRRVVPGEQRTRRRRQGDRLR